MDAFFFYFHRVHTYTHTWMNNNKIQGFTCWCLWSFLHNPIYCVLIYYSATTYTALYYFHQLLQCTLAGKTNKQVHAEQPTCKLDILAHLATLLFATLVKSKRSTKCRNAKVSGIFRCVYGLHSASFEFSTHQQQNGQKPEEDLLNQWYLNLIKSY